MAFVLSFIVCTIFQLTLPNVFNIRPNIALAGANTQTWTTRGDFLGGNPDANMKISGVNSEDDAAATFVDPQEFKGAISVAAGQYHSLALMADGTVKSWGRDNVGQLGDDANQTDKRTPVNVAEIDGLSSSTRAIAIAAGRDHSLALMADGTIKSWGYDNNGQLGDDASLTLKPTPVNVSGITGATTALRAIAISAGSYHSLALMADGTVKSWGYDAQGQLGNDSSLTNQPTPVTVSVITGGTANIRATAVAGGWGNSFALMADGTVKSWGYDAQGQLGDNATLLQQPTPVTVSVITGGTAATRATMISATELGGYAQMADGTVKSWGSDYQGGLGDDASITNKPTPVTVAGITAGTADVRASKIIISGAASHGIALMADGTVKSWGWDNQGQLGDGGGNTSMSTPVNVSGITGGTAGVRAISVAGGSYHSLALMADGSVQAWGDDAYGQLGDDEVLADKTTPVNVAVITSSNASLRAIEVEGGGEHSLALMADGTVKAWGRDNVGQLGDDANLTNQLAPVTVAGINGSTAATRAISIDAGYNHSLALMADGTVKAWGYNFAGAVGDNSTTTRPTPVSVNVIDGTTAATRAVAIEAGNSFSIALMADGTIKSWGYNDAGRLGDGTTTQRLQPVSALVITGGTAATRAKAISIGEGHSTAVMADGTVKSWGSNYNGQIGDNTEIDKSSPTTMQVVTGGTADTRATLVSAGSGHTIILMADGTVKSVGRNDNGQLGNGSWTYSATKLPVSVLVIDSSTAALRAVKVATGEYHSMALMADGTIKSWGLNEYGRLGDGTTTRRLSPISTLIINGSTPDVRASDISGGWSYSLALMTKGSLKSWGNNQYGPLGDGTTTQRTSPVNVSVITGGDFITFSYPSSGVIPNLQINSGTGVKSDWSNASWLTETLPANTSITVAARTSDNGSSWSAWSSDIVQSSGTSQSGSLTALTASQYLEVKVILATSDGAATPTLNSLSVTYDSLEAPSNSNLTLSKTTGSDTNLYNSSGTAITAGVAGGYTNEDSIKVTATGLTCTDCATAPTNLRPEVEVKALGSAFTGTGTVTATAGTNYATVTGLTNGTSYHIQVRAVDDEGRASAWTSYGNNAENVADFSIEQTAPTGSISINGGATFATSTSIPLTISGSDTGGSNVGKMRLSNNGTTWSDWQTYASDAYDGTPTSWDLTTYGGNGNDGSKTVYIQYMDNAGNVSGTWTQTTDADFNGGTKDNITVSSNSFNITSLTPPANTVDNGDGTWTTTIYSESSDGSVHTCANQAQYDYMDNAQVGATMANCDDSYDMFYRVYTKYNLSSITGTINSAKYKINYYSKVNGETDISLKSIADYGANLDIVDWNLPIYSDLGIIFNGASSYGYSDYTVTSAVTADKSAGRTYSTFSLSFPETPGIYPIYYFYTSRRVDSKPYLSVTWTPPIGSGNLISSSRDNTTAQNYGNISWTATIPSQTGPDALRFQVASNNDNATWNFIGPDGTNGTYYTTSGTGLHSSHNGHRYIKYKAYLDTDDSNYTPTVYDVSIVANNTILDSITLDTTPPANVSGLASYSDSGKLTPLTTNTWYPYNAPYFEWSANGDSDLSGYKYCFSTNVSCSPTTDLGNVTNYTVSPALTTNTTYYFRVVAYDQANQSSTTPTTFIYKFDDTIPGRITGLTASNNDLTRIILSWNAFADGASPLDNYKLERVKHSTYIDNSWNLSSDWSSGNHNVTGYGVFTLTNNSFTDDSNSPAQSQVAIETATRYIFKITVKDTANSNYSLPQLSEVTGMTTDGVDPSHPSSVAATACDGTLTYCSDINNRGFEIHLTWAPSTDTGTGVDHYNIYRAVSAPDNPASFTKIAEVDYPNDTFFDNDSVHADPANRLNDYTTYYYRVTAVDSATPTPNESDLLPGIDPFLNSDSGTTPDVTPPSIPDGVSATAMGLDGSDPNTDVVITDGSGTVSSATINTLTDSGKSWTTDSLKGLTVKIVSGTGADQSKTISSNTATSLTTTTNWGTTPDSTSHYEIYEGHQRVTISWSASTDTKARSTGLGSGVKEYKVYRDTNPEGSFTDLVGTTTDLTINDDRRADYTYYYYKVTATDNADPANTSEKSDLSGARTATSAVPTTPTNVTVTSKKGNPNTDTEVGHKVTLTFKGSYARYYQITKYEVYRATTNTSGSCNPGETPADCWVRVNSATKLNDINITPIQDDRDTTYTVTDSNLINATTYYYKVRSIDNTPEDPDNGPFYSSLSSTNTGVLNSGWDITPDDTAPTIPSNGGVGLEVKVRDTHPNDVELRNIVTWRMLTGAQLPTRNGVNDFARYEVWREIYNPTTDALLNTAKVASVTNVSNNYYTDTISLSDTVSGIFYIKDCKLKYYIVIVDNANTHFKYANDTVINPAPEGADYSNVSAKAYWTDSIIPAQSKPSLVGLVTLSNVQVASAVVSWTTDQEADSLVQYRIYGSSGDWVTVGQIERTLTHSVRLFGLNPLTRYEYQIVSRNYLGNNVEDFGTLPILTTSGFTITPGSVNTTTTGAEITWTTNLDAATAVVEYELIREGNDEPQGKAVGVSAADLLASPRDHRVVIQGLKSDRAYKYTIKSVSKDNFVTSYPTMENEGRVSEQFNTKAFDTGQFTLAPSSSNVAERNITATTAQIIWQTGMDATSWVDYGTKSGVYDYSAGNDNLTKQHVVVIEGLVPGTVYYYRVRAKDANDIEYTSQEYSFKAILKPKIENMRVSKVTPYEVTISWETNIETETMINWGTTAAYGQKIGKQGLSKAHEITVDDLTDNTEYHYQILAKDEMGNEVADDDKIVRTPLDTEGPKIESVKTDILPIGADEAAASVIISWQTNKPATTLVEYDEGIIGGRYSMRSIEDKTLNNSHTVIIKDLKPASSYHFKIVSKDKRGNIGTSPDHTFVTPSKEKSILQLILKSLEETFSWTKNLGKFFTGVRSRLFGK